MPNYIWLIPTLPLAGSAIIGLLGLIKLRTTGEKLGKRVVSAIALAAVGLAFVLSVLAVYQLFAVQHEELFSLDLFTWLSYRCFVAKGEESIPIFGEFGLMQQLGVAAYRRPRRFRERLEEWLDLVKLMWPDCPARLSSDGQRLLLSPGRAIRAQGDLDACA